MTIYEVNVQQLPFYNIKTQYSLKYKDFVAEWLRRWTANPLGSARASSNLVKIDYI